jgi:hypothetical protein
MAGGLERDTATIDEPDQAGIVDVREGLPLVLDP